MKKTEKTLTPERREELIGKFREINGMGDPKRRGYFVQDGKDKLDDEVAINQIIFLDHFLPEANGDLQRASSNYATWITRKSQIKDEILVQIAERLAEKRSRYLGRQRSEENDGYYEIIRAFLKSSPRKKTFLVFKEYWRNLPLKVRNNNINIPFDSDTFIRWRNSIISEAQG